MDGIIIVLLIALFAFGVTGISTMVRSLRQVKQKRIPLRSCPKRWLITVFSLLIVAVMLSVGSLYWLTDNYILEGAPYSFQIENAIAHYGDFGNYKVLERIDTGFSLDPIIIIQNDDVDLVVCTLKTRNLLIGLKKYWVNGGFTLVDGQQRFGYVIDENRVYGGAIETFPDIWFGIVYPDKRDHIRVNGKIPILKDIHFNGEDYVFWYIQKDGDTANLSFD